MHDTRTIAPEVLDEIIRRIVQVAKPDKIILFGSAARGENLCFDAQQAAEKAIKALLIEHKGKVGTACGRSR